MAEFAFPRKRRPLNNISRVFGNASGLFSTTAPLVVETTNCVNCAASVLCLPEAVSLYGFASRHETIETWPAVDFESQRGKLAGNFCIRMD